MPNLHLGEFMDQSWVSGGLRTTLREILESGNSRPFRPYYEWVAAEVSAAANAHGMSRLVELGAGMAPITRHLARRSDLPADAKLMPSDINPDIKTFRHLQLEYPDRIEPVFDEFDFAKVSNWPPGTLVYLSATLHHIPVPQRWDVLREMARSADRVLVFEPLRRTLMAMLLVFLSLVPALLTPLRYWNRPGKFRRILWCWLVPVAPVMFWWDGLVSCLRMSSYSEWQTALATIVPKAGNALVEESLFCQKIEIEGQCSAVSLVERPLESA